MKLSKEIVAVLFICCLLYNLTANSQTFSIDTTSFLNPYEQIDGPEYYDYDEPDLISNELTTKDMMFIPGDVLYHNRWDTLNIRTGRTDWSKISDTTILFLNNLRESNFVFPYKGKIISPYGPRGGRFHAGVDIKLDKGDTIVSAFDGKVRIARSISGYGKIVVIRHNNGLETVYGHLSAYLVDVNDEVKAGDPVGLGGHSGRASTDHLHFETRILGEHFNPNKIIDFESYSLKDNFIAFDKTNFGFGVKSQGMGQDETTPDHGNSKYVKIKQGDTLYALALKHKTTVDRICKMNGITPKKVLKVGSRIRIQ